ncbi:hypothetical protein [Rhizobium sp. SAFR-030]|uniref:hypothetical protein n=1 Tax=Rhizobium sp. SAFR-030 TaxID=3387277 RepID=UPI003F7D1833
MSRRLLLNPTAAILLVTVVCAAMLGLSGRTVTAAFINDVLIFLDGAHRVSFGQVPNRDFHTALGPLVFYVPALGYWLTGNFGAAMPLGMALLVLAFAPAMIRILTSRLNPLLAVTLGVFLILILAAPINLGSPIGLLSFAMFYNRIGWAALALLLVMVLPPYEKTRDGAGHSPLVDGLAASFLLLIQIYTKVTYGLVGAGFLVFMLFDRRQARWVWIAFAVTAAACLLIEAVWHGSLAHLQDLAAAAKVSGGKDFPSLVRSLLNNLADVTVFLIITGVALARTRSLTDLLFYGFCLAAGLMILNQNAHGWGIITLYAGAAVAVERISRLRSDAVAAAPPALHRGLPLILAFFFVPPIVHHAGALLLHTAYALGNSGKPLGLPRFADVRNIDPDGGQPDFMQRYIDDIESGGDLLLRLPAAPERVLALDFVNPFSAGLGIAPPSGDSAWLHWGRNVSETSHLPPEALFADVEIVMIPQSGINGAPLRKLYGPYILQRFELLQETSAWTVYQRRQP